MRPFCFILFLALSATFYFQLQSPAEVPKTASGASSSSENAHADKLKPEDVLRRMSDYLGSLPALACHLEATLEFKAEKEEPQREVTKMTARLLRPNKLALIVDQGKMGLTIVSDGKKLTQFLPELKRYTSGDAPTDFAEMTDVGVPLKFIVLGSTGQLIPIGGDAYYQRLVAGAKSSQFVGKEKVGGVLCNHLHFVDKRFDWDIWIEDGKQPVVEKVDVDLSKQFTDEKVTVHYAVVFSDWNVAPKFKDADFAFKPPAGAEQADVLIEPDPPHPLVGKPAPPFKTVDLNDHPFDLKSHLGKDVILLDFWATSCGPCVMLMPEPRRDCQEIRRPRPRVSCGEWRRRRRLH